MILWCVQESGFIYKSGSILSRVFIRSRRVFDSQRSLTTHLLYHISETMSSVLDGLFTLFGHFFAQKPAFVQ